MAFNKLGKPRLWFLAVESKNNLSDKDRDFIAELVSEEARKTIETYEFILHDTVESKKYCEILIEGTKTAISNLLSAIKNNLPYQITCNRNGMKN